MRRSRSRTATIDCRCKGTGKILVSPLTATPGSLMPNSKTAGGDRVHQFIFGLFTNEGVEVALCYALEERAHLVFVSVDLKLHTTVQQVAYPARDIEALGDMSHRPAETDALDVTLIKHLERDHRLPKMLDASYLLLDGNASADENPASRI